ncbi:MAG: hypothetical protein ACK5C8_07355 [Roseiflexaceae bacterium]|jgi:hypothetical protein|nr:hypothetical protein [Chloroflexaceae bacterium]
MMFSKPTLWQSQTNNERIDYLNRLANEVSARDRRGEMFVVNGGIRPGGINETSDVLSINANFISQDTPYNAIESVFNRSSVAQQRHIAAHPELAESPEQLKNIQDNVEYYEDRDPYIHRLQPVEQQARHTARTDMENMFGMGDLAYDQHRQARDTYDAQQDQEAVDSINNDYKLREFHGSAQDKVSQYISQQADLKRQQAASQTTTALDTTSKQTHSQQQEEQQQDTSYQRRR